MVPRHVSRRGSARKYIRPVVGTRTSWGSVRPVIFRRRGLIADFISGADALPRDRACTRWALRGDITGISPGFVADSSDLGWANWISRRADCWASFMPCRCCCFCAMRPGLPGATVVGAHQFRPRSANCSPRDRFFVAYCTSTCLHSAWVVRDWMPAILQKELKLTQGIRRAYLGSLVWWQGAAISALWAAGRWPTVDAVEHSRRIHISAIGMGFDRPGAAWRGAR